MRNLASIQKIKHLEPIEGADQILKATVLGWQLVVKKSEFKVGDLCVYCEIDSLMPETPDFEFLKPRAMRIRTIRLRGQISQGICFPLALVKNYGLLPEMVVEGQDITERLGIVKYEPPIPANLAGDIKGNFPSFIPKTDETRIQVLQHILDKYKNTSCYVAEKIDGSSVTYYLRNGEFGVCSRNWELTESITNTLWKVARALDIENKLKSLGYNCGVQGEIIGEGVQGNKYKLKGQSVLFFNFFDIDKFRYVNYSDFKEKMLNLNLEIVPILDENYTLQNDVEVLVKTSIAKSVLHADIWREGIVIRPLNEIVDSNDSNGLLQNDRISFKVINPEFLIKYDD